MSDENRAFVFKCLRKLDSRLSEPIMVDIQVALGKAVETVNIKALADFTVGLRSGDYDMSTICGIRLGHGLVLAPFTGTIRRAIDTMQTAEEVNSVTVAMCGVHRLLSYELTETYITNVNALIDRGVFEDKKHGTKALLKIISLTQTYPHVWRGLSDFLNKVVSQFKGKLHTLTPYQLIVVGYSVQDICGPPEITKEVDHLIEKFLECQESSTMCQNHSDQSQPIPCLEYLMYIQKRHPVTVSSDHHKARVMDAIKGPFFVNSMETIYFILKYSPIGNDQDILETFLHRAFEEYTDNWQNFTRLCLKYLNFDLEHIKLRRSTTFEAKMVDYIKPNLLETPYPTAFFAQMVFLAHSKRELPEKVMER